jgi:phospholipase/carboxylesterase
LLGLVPELDGRFFCVSARAPYAVDRDAYAWFHAEFKPEGTVIRAEEAESSRILLIRFIDELIETYGLDARRVFLMGFSQGAITSLSVTLTRPDKIAGAVIMSGRLLPEVLPLVDASEKLVGLPIIVTHGTMDGVLPIRLGREVRDRLSVLRVSLEYHEYPMGHEISRQSLGDISAWLKERLG